MTTEVKSALQNYLLRLADSSLVQGHRLSEWCGHAPILEEDIALTNISLDLVGQARLFYTYASEIENKERTEDDFAYLRDVLEFKNVLLVEQPNGDYAQTITKVFLFSLFQKLVYEQLKNSVDAKLAAIAGKSLKEVAYHYRHSSEWVLRLGDGTDESNKRMVNAVEELWQFTYDMFEEDENFSILIKEKIVTPFGPIKEEWRRTANEKLTEATLNTPDESFMVMGSLNGKHSEHLGYILAELQFLPRAYPDAKW